MRLIVEQGQRLQGNFERCACRTRSGARCKRKKYRTFDRAKLIHELQPTYPFGRIASCMRCYRRVMRYGSPTYVKRHTQRRDYRK